MLRFDRFTAGRYWVDDYGLPTRRPTSGRSWPTRPITTSSRRSLPAGPDDDGRHGRPRRPGHSFKYAPRSRQPTGRCPHLIRIETRAGHGAGKPSEDHRGSCRRDGLLRPFHGAEGRLGQTRRPGAWRPAVARAAERLGELCIGSASSSCALCASGDWAFSAAVRSGALTRRVIFAGFRSHQSPRIPQRIEFTRFIWLKLRAGKIT